MTIRSLLFLPLLLVLCLGVFPPGSLAEAPGLELYMANPEVRIAQKIYCQIANPNQTHSLRATLDGTVIHTKGGALQAEEVFVADYRNLRAGRHTLAVQILDGDSQVVADATREWTTLHNGSPKVGINEHNAICVNGVPFFPITSWMLNKSSFDFPIADTINTLLSDGYYPEHTIDTWKDYLTSADPYGWFVAGPNRWDGFNRDDPRNSDTAKLVRYVQETRDHSDRLLAWYWDDEPDLGGSDTYNPATVVNEWTRLTHQNDTNHPVWFNFVGYNLTHAESAWHNNRIKEYCFLYNADKFDGKRTAVTDIFSIDYYPYEYATQENYQQWISVEDYALALDRAREWNYDLLPTVGFIETQDIHDEQGVGHDKPCGWPKDYEWTPDPTPAELENLIWVSVIHRAKGLSWFHYFCPTPEGNLEVMRMARQTIEQLTPAILGPDSEIVVREEELDGGRVDILVKAHDGNLYIFAANLRKKVEPVRFTLQGLPKGKSVQLWNQDRTIVSQDGFFEDLFGGLGVHIYVIRDFSSNPDLDSDGMPNSWEESHGLNHEDPSDAGMDADGDGFTNLREYEGGTDPNDPKDHPNLLVSGLGESSSGWSEVFWGDYTQRSWFRVGWSEYNALRGEARMATGDIDGDGRDEMVLGLGPVDRNSGVPGGWFQVLDDDGGHLAWGRVNWSSYNAANGETWPSCGDLDGDGRDEIVMGLGSGGSGWVEVFSYESGSLSHEAWVQVRWSSYRAEDGQTRPTCGDIDGDGRDEIVVGLGSSGSGWFEVLDDSLLGYTHLGWGRVQWSAYTGAHGETRPTCGDLDGDGRDEIVVGLGRSGGGYMEVLDDATTGHQHLAWPRIHWSANNQTNGETWPGVKK